MLAERVVEWTENWKQQGLQQGLQQGRREGRQEGRQEGEEALLQKLLQRRFGTLPNWAGQRIAQASTDQLENWGLNLLDAHSLDDVFNRASCKTIFPRNA